MMENHTTDMNRALFSKRYCFISAFCPCEQELDFHTTHARWINISIWLGVWTLFRPFQKFLAISNCPPSWYLTSNSLLSKFYVILFIANVMQLHSIKLHGESSTHEHAYTCGNQEKFSCNLQRKIIIQNSFPTCSKIKRLSIFCVFLNWVSLYHNRHSEQAFECWHV